MSKQWLKAALLAGVAYVVIGRAFAVPTANVQTWRLAAWAASAGVFAAHIWYEHARRSSTPAALAFHTSVAVALGGFGLAIAGMMHAMSEGLQLGAAWLLALILWPAITAIPAYCVAFVAGSVLARVRS